MGKFSSCRGWTGLAGLALLLLFAGEGLASDWRLIGPEGGDVRSLASNPANPSQILLGTSAGQMFVSPDGGSSWSLFAHLGADDDYVLDHILFDPSHPSTIYVAAWSLFNSGEGDVFRSGDGGRTWSALSGMHGKSVRALAMAPSDPKTLVAGTLDGVFRSNDGGNTWQRISPEGHAEIKNIESLAIDPNDADIIYAGTWHLPWKTSDGGRSWHSISRGIAYDSDMFSIIVDPHAPATVYASACSGMYKSLDRAEQFRRILGLPHSAMRTRALRQDPLRPNIIYAGTTGGLWKTVDGGDQWQLVSDAGVIVNDVLIDPRNPEHVLAATDRGGVLASNDGFRHYAASNRGFAHRLLGGVMVDRQDPSRLYAGVVNDKDLGGFFVSDDGGKNWRQSNQGLGERDVLSLQEGEDGSILAGTNHGIFYRASLEQPWQAAAMSQGPPSQPQAWKPSYHPAGRASRQRQPRASGETVAAENAAEQAPRVRALARTGTTWFAATNDGLFSSTDQGRNWYGVPVEGESDFIVLNSYTGDTLTLISPRRAFLSRDGGKSWNPVRYPAYVTGLYDLTLEPGGAMWMATREGALRSSDGGKSWEHMLGGLPSRQVLAVEYDAGGRRLLATALHVHGVLESRDGGQKWQRSADTGVSIRSALSYQGRLLAASAYNGLLLEDESDVARSEAAPVAGNAAARQ